MLDRQRQHPHRLLWGVEPHRVLRCHKVHQELRLPLPVTCHCDHRVRGIHLQRSLKVAHQVQQAVQRNTAGPVGAILNDRHSLTDLSLALAQHYARVAEVILPHVPGRPLSLVRCPSGSAAECFYQKHWSGKRPEFIDTVDIKQSDGKKHPHVVIHEVKGLICVDWMRNSRGATAVAPWSTRARPAAGVAVPIPWSQLATLASGDQFTLLTVRNTTPRSDPWQGLLDSRQHLKALAG